jgi:hypothetical protein
LFSQLSKTARRERGVIAPGNEQPEAPPPLIVRRARIKGAIANLCKIGEFLAALSVEVIPTWI